MNVHVKGKIILEGMSCKHCNGKILDHYVKETEICNSCGAKYKLVNVNTSNNQPNVEYIFVGFNCIELNFYDSCTNMCPAPFMFCENHSNEASIEKAEKLIEDAKEKVIEAEEKLKAIKESRKNWMITELSGIKDE